MPLTRAVYQYDLYGNFIREFKSLKEAGEHINSRSSSISQVCQRKWETAYGFQWRYAEEIDDPNEKIGLGKHNVDEDMWYLRMVWYGFCQRTRNPDDKMYDPDIYVHPPWEEFDTFYYDIIEDYEEFMARNPTYKKEIKIRHSNFGRINKNKGWYPENTQFMTPDLNIRHKNETYKIIRDGRTITSGMIAEELEAIGISVSDNTILSRMRDNEGLLEPNHYAQHLLYGKYYSLVQLSEIFGFGYDYVKSRMRIYGETWVEAATHEEEVKKYSFKDHKNLKKCEYLRLLAQETGIKITTITGRFDSGWSEEKILNTPLDISKKRE